MLVQLQYLRAIAALMVVYFHSVLQVPKVNAGFDWQFHLFGETGVDIFFVLSGFVMWLTTVGRRISPIEFYRRRIKRIVPLYWLATIFSAVVALIAPTILKSTVFNLPHLVASLLFLPWRNPADPDLITPIVVPGWTLNYEMFFYCVFGLLLLVPERWRLYSLFGAMTAIIVGCHLLPFQSTATTFYGDPIIYEFLAGVVLAKLYLEKIFLPQRLAWPAIALGFAFLLINETLCDASMRSYMWGIPAVIIVYSAVSIDFSRLPEIGWLNYLGDASYSVYITHAFTLAFLRVACGILKIDIVTHGPVFVTSCMIFSAIGGAIVHELTTPTRWKKWRRSAPVLASPSKASPSKG
ncbi:acyltransferase [Neorhizobium sp. P12A]|uniref:acyltransferase family protein n=1 Tax=Neorhizobium sp. P12A TaxID=2268027 RepID=UPI0011EDE81A|nr:acyltransferase [Neorhizobium sp. P12A]KAA0699167.1 acyltransferase [Neorhizobium sp. P12A]